MNAGRQYNYPYNGKMYAILNAPVHMVHTTYRCWSRLFFIFKNGSNIMFDLNCRLFETNFITYELYFVRDKCFTAIE